MYSPSFVIQEDPINDVILLNLSSNEGARLVFTGLVRECSEGRQGVSRIEYHCYKEMAEQEGSAILQNALTRFEIHRIACVHRVGLVSLQETVIRVEIGSEHRLAGLKACEFVMDQIKIHVPIWKKEYYKDGAGQEEKGDWRE